MGRAFEIASDDSRGLAGRDLSAELRTERLRREEADAGRLGAVRLEDAIPRRFAGALLPRVDQREIVELDQLLQPAAHGGIRDRERLANRAPRDAAIPLVGQRANARVRLAERFAEIRERLAQD